ncbi:hypothetical protein BJF79_33660 [Actinomadura sp. CNU-125]|uniref:RNA polymerase sigma factor n=1 Tax=Actinomadura sp. CNU-125 TaxID=1904961 RepID=UPI000966687A|nr:sigma-70 family RNA polymerase sigma factor [Actinomadura sp. CNU-125]OLT34228.1 hypothetical protein BJF79_33660 [Actinomadura sp. CNU-125]
MFDQDTAVRATTNEADRVRGGNALAVAERSFQLLTTGPKPLGLDGRTIGHGLPGRVVSLAELRTLLLEQAASDGLKDAAWRELVQRARSDDPAWVVGCVGVAMPGLKNTAARALRTTPERYAEDIVAELLTEFVAQLARIDIDRPHIAARLMLWARKGALRVRGRETQLVPYDPSGMPEGPAAATAEDDPVHLLLDSVRQGIVTPDAAELVIATRLEGLSVQEIARRRQLPASRLYKQRHAAEVRIVAAVKDGRISSTSTVGFPGM